MTESRQHAATPSVLLVEDEPALRELITLLLEDLGATVTALPSADEGIAALKLKPWALVITDVRTPGVSTGLQLAWIARRDLPVTGVIVTSGYHPQINEALPHGIRFLPKPWALEAFIELVRPYLIHQVDQRPAA
ncbi:response regulator [Pseudomonas sp. GD03651]|uniref:response regulator n=1 Tax=unclassified Pseudomonas TaxID=196821 RepID=UPI0024486F8C|nr:response regulator [Pseudomonas sp. GD03651]MDH2184681.1 response regulator [Pseudomonas sp. GD03651]